MTGAPEGARIPRERDGATGADWPLEGIELAIFDKDGTLIEFALMWSDWVGALADELAKAHGSRVDDVVYATMGVDRSTGLIHPHGALAATPMARLRAVLAGALRDAGFTEPEAERVVRVAWHSPDPVALARPVTDLGALFRSLRDRGIRIAVATSDDRDPTERTLDHLGVAPLIDGVACADDGRPVKPAPDSVTWLCRSIGVPVARTAVIGDSPADLLMGRAAGAAVVVGVLTGVGDLRTLGPLADLVVGSIEDLAPID